MLFFGLLGLSLVHGRFVWVDTMWLIRWFRRIPSHFRFMFLGCSVVQWFSQGNGAGSWMVHIEWIDMEDEMVGSFQFQARSG